MSRSSSSSPLYDTVTRLAEVAIVPLCVTLLSLYKSKCSKYNWPFSSFNNAKSPHSRIGESKTNYADDVEPEMTHTLKDAIAIVKQWKRCHLAVDVGASNVRLAFLNPSNQKIILAPKTPSNSMTQLLGVFAEVDVLLGDCARQTGRGIIEAACLAVAGPISGDTISLTNYTARDSTIHKNELPEKLFPKKNTFFLNDLEACSFGVVRMGLRGSLWEYFLPNHASHQFKNHHYAVLAMGTGLGASLVFAVNNRQGKDADLEFDVVPLELGHIYLNHELRNNDRDRLDFVASKVYESEFSPEVEEICSGRGLVHCYEYEVKDSTKTANIRARDIAELVVKGDQSAQNAMRAHYLHLYKAAQTLSVLVPQCKGVFLCGDNQVANEAFVSEHLQEFEDEFYLNHPKKEWLQDVKIYRQVKGLNMNLQGGFHYIQTHMKH